MAKKKKNSNSQAQQPPDVLNVGNLWTPEDKRLFHVAVAQLYKKTELQTGHHKDPGITNRNIELIMF